MNKRDWPIIALVVLFLLKAFSLAIWVTPLWGIPDEVGHYAYAEDIALGRGLPILGVSKISSEVNTSSQRKNSSSSHNWIAQHPPLYYMMAAIPIRITAAVTSDSTIKFTSPRIIAVVAGGASLFVIYRTLLLLRLDRATSTTVAASISVIPLFSTLASGTNHDVPLMFVSTLVAYFFVRFILSGSRAEAYWCATMLSAAAAVKFTALVMLAPIVAFIILEQRGSLGVKFRFAVRIIALSLFLPGIWFVRNLYLFGTPFFDDLDLKKSSTALQHVGFLEFMRSHPVVEHFFINFLGWFGGGKAGGAFQLYGWPLAILSLVMLGFFAVLAFEACRLLFRAPGQDGAREGSIVETVSYYLGLVVGTKREVVVSAVFMAMLGSVVVLWARTDSGTDYTRSLAGMLLVFSGIVALAIPVFGTQPPKTRLFAYCLVIVGFFSAVLVVEIFEVSKIFGTMRATNGRYLYPVVPFALIAFGIAATRWRLIRIAAPPVVILMAYVEMETYLAQAVPFYG